MPADQVTLVTLAERIGVVRGTVIAVLSATSVTGSALREGSPALVPRTSNGSLNKALSRLGATSIQPLFARLPANAAGALTAAALQRLGSLALNLGDIVLVHVDKSISVAGASKLAATSGNSFAEPDR
ncbi:MAG TPA: hypothetical protein VMA72_16760 [Streptosporangiaceae bacterium]|nr:hypothetical protein [Streptosporangiaceae bacterium]